MYRSNSFKYIEEIFDVISLFNLKKKQYNIRILHGYKKTIYN